MCKGDSALSELSVTDLHITNKCNGLAQKITRIFLDLGGRDRYLITVEKTVRTVVRNLGILVLAGVLSASSSASLTAAAGAGQAAAAGSLSGTASSSGGETMANTVIQLRNLATGQLAGSTTSSAAGQFSFIGLNPGNYAVEVVNATGQIVGTSASVSVSAGAAVSGVSVTASAAVAATAGAGAGAAAGVAAAGGAAAAGATSTAAIVGASAAAAGVAGAAYTNETASPSE